jgi:hypothetical protein
MQRPPPDGSHDLRTISERGRTAISEGDHPAFGTSPERPPRTIRKAIAHGQPAPLTVVRVDPVPLTEQGKPGREGTQAIARQVA